MHTHWPFSTPNWGHNLQNEKKKIRMVVDDRRVKVWKITEAVGISGEQVHYIFHNFRHEKTIRPKVAVISQYLVDCEQSWHSCDHFELEFVDVAAWSKGVFELIHNCGRDMDAPLYTRDKGIVRTVNFCRWMCTAEGEDGLIRGKGDGHSFLGCTWKTTINSD